MRDTWLSSICIYLFMEMLVAVKLFSSWGASTLYTAVKHSTNLWTVERNFKSGKCTKQELRISMSNPKPKSRRYRQPTLDRSKKSSAVRIWHAYQ
jgi:hypothetical protein